MAADKQKTEKERERERCVQRRLRGGGTKYRAARKVQLWADMQFVQMRLRKRENG